MMEERYNATTKNRFYPDMSNVNKNITVEAKLISSPSYMTIHCLFTLTCFGGTPQSHTKHNDAR